MKNLLIAGGTGLVGKRLQYELELQGHKVSILSRNPKGKDQFFWNPADGKIDESCLKDVQILINLSGAGIADERWTDARKKELYDSRIDTNTFLFEQLDKMPNLEQFITSSGINAYGFDNDARVYIENDTFGTDYISQLVKEWEESADLFKEKCKVVKIRTAVVLDENGGALARMLTPIKMGMGSPLGSGEQVMCWIHAVDLARLFAHVIEHQLEGAFNAIGGYCSNKEFMKSIADELNKPFWFPSVPAFSLKLLFGEMAILLLKGIKASNAKILSTGFTFQYTDLKLTLKNILSEK